MAHNTSDVAQIRRFRAESVTEGEVGSRDLVVKVGRGLDRLQQVSRIHWSAASYESLIHPGKIEKTYRVHEVAHSIHSLFWLSKQLLIGMEVKRFLHKAAKKSPGSQDTNGTRNFSKFCSLSLYWKKALLTHWYTEEDLHIFGPWRYSFSSRFSQKTSFGHKKDKG